jgi:hypothetical protein
MMSALSSVYPGASQALKRLLVRLPKMSNEFSVLENYVNRPLPEREIQEVHDCSDDADYYFTKRIDNW